MLNPPAYTSNVIISEYTDSIYHQLDRTVHHSIYALKFDICSRLLKYLTSYFRCTDVEMELKVLLGAVDSSMPFEELWTRCESTFLPIIPSPTISSWAKLGLYKKLFSFIKGKTYKTFAAGLVKQIRSILVWKENQECADWIDEIESSIEDFGDELDYDVPHAHNSLRDLLKLHFYGETTPSSSYFSTRPVVRSTETPKFKIEWIRI